jgi:hypothetical protein
VGEVARFLDISPAHKGGQLRCNDTNTHREQDYRQGEGRRYRRWG